MKRSIVIVAFPGMQSLDVVGPFEVFAGASNAVDKGKSRSSSGYSVSLVSPTGKLVASESGLALATSPLPRGAIDTLVLPGGTGISPSQTHCFPMAIRPWRP